MTFAPATITALAAYWTAHGGVNLGIVGDAAHAASGGYHEGRDDLVRAGVLATDYSVRTARDKAGLSNAASAIDLGRLNGSLTELQDFSRWFLGQCRASAPGTADCREFIFADANGIVWRWDRERGAASIARPGEADASHLTHSHLSFYRDAEHRDKVPLFAPYFEVDAMGLDPKTDVPAAVCDVAAGGPLMAADKTTVLHPSWAGGKGIGLYARPLVTKGFAAIRIDRAGGPAEQLELAWVPNNRVGNVRVPGAVDATPFDQADIDLAVKTATDPLNARIAAAKAALG